MRRAHVLTIFLLIESIYADGGIINELDAAWDKLEQTVSTGDFRLFKSVYHHDAVLVNGITKK